MTTKISTVLLVAILTIGVSYNCYANNPVASGKKFGIFSKLGENMGVLLLCSTLLLCGSTSLNVYQSWVNHRITKSYEKLAGETKVLRDSYANLASSLLGENEHPSIIGPEFDIDFMGAGEIDSIDGTPIRMSVISFDDRLTPDYQAAADGIDVEYTAEMRQAGIAFRSVDIYNSKKEALPANFYVGLTVFYYQDGDYGVGKVQSITDNGDEQLLFLDEKHDEIAIRQSEIEGVLVTRHPFYTDIDIDVEFPAASMESFNNRGLPQNYLQTSRRPDRPDKQSDHLDIITDGSLQGKLIMASTGDKSIIKIVFPNGEEFFVLVHQRDLTPLDADW